MVSGYPTSTNIPQVDGLSTDPQVLGRHSLSQETYDNDVLEIFNMIKCSLSLAPIMKGERFNLSKCPKIDFEWEHMKNILYASAVGSIMYA